MGRNACTKEGHAPRADGRCRQCLKASQMRHYRANSPEYKKRANQWGKNNPEKRRAILRRYNYGSQNVRTCPEVCELCNERKATCFDHDHVTGKFRGWLCHRCNQGLGALGDSLVSVAAALEYLVRAI